MSEKKDKVTKVLEEIVKNPDEFFQTFSEEIAEKARQELRRAFFESQESKKTIG